MKTKTGLRWLLLITSAAAVAAGCGNPDPIAVGNTPPAFAVLSLPEAAKIVDLNSLKGKVVLVDFWATWCGPCNMELPKVEKVWERYRDKGVEMLAISTESREVLAKFQKTTGTDVPIYIDADGKASASLNVTGLPTTFVIGKDGKVVYSSVGYAPGDEDLIESAINKALL